MSALLRANGFETVVTHDGADAFAKGEEFHPQIVFLDIGMPTLDGYQACKAMRETEWGNRALIIALTG